jgi:Cu(I)/Ag(I) efflux system membrane fusion protein
MVANARIQSAWKQAGDAIVIPKTAVLWTGKRSIVYVKQANSEMPAFRLREIELGPSLEDAYIVLSGLHEGEEIVTNGAFSLDAAAQLEGKPSMMNDDAHAVLTVQGACDMCKERIESAAKSLTGVAKAEWNQESKALHLNYNPQKTNLEAIGKALAKAGHDNELFKAPDKVYDALPGCCKYSRSNGVEIEHG